MSPAAASCAHTLSVPCLAESPWMPCSHSNGHCMGMPACRACQLFTFRQRKLIPGNAGTYCQSMSVCLRPSHMCVLAPQKGAHSQGARSTPAEAEAAAQKGAHLGRALLRGVQATQPGAQQICPGGGHHCCHQPGSVLHHTLTCLSGPRDALSGNLYNTMCLVNMGFFEICELYTMQCCPYAGTFSLRRHH